ncbi:undecaprenyldiphospho-muramoylpentapeptide beta-N-acetylglucosaminyltransferase [Chitiniphilus eburneus]|uniref:UDP-N-acetylglucosamine--N-acetylmuramyl-(pentapeptide) pyrophosphoryl-undecaprenol N-acetylglucosamine transferase n=1 Tax=Chitiniphilus eburneus TaxID=2571148 RepID=A0A4U0Q8B4_9NEIS|nr:undecaprenyldiphospho-muramoylpentapeptide beta-N-acetylglucosaminyltransferase [Chitiniphilus eburneus]TJZ77425.1 undecaprenyldiphospho-muramoylpentapeptide beta-N-acetylglucosaminyltransferase [Chitiniphilus eburneus]
MSRIVMITTGGTGGHIFPGLAIAHALQAQGVQVFWLGTRNGMESKLVPQHGVDFEALDFASVRGRGKLALLLAPFTVTRALLQATGVLLRRRPDVVLGLGGYVSFPGALMAGLLRVPLVVHTADAVAGLANRWLGRLATRVLSGFPDAFGADYPRPVQWTGNPIRAEIAALPDPDTRYAGREGPLRVLVVGGSLGAQALNDIVPQALARLPEAQRPLVIHQAGAKQIDALKANYAAAGVLGDCRAFIDDMAGAYRDADLVICRAGAVTVAELAAAGAPSVLVPYPYHKDQQQLRNARFIADAGGALLLEQKDLTPDTLANALAGLDRAELARMGRAARAVAKPEATAQVAATLVELAG